MEVQACPLSHCPSGMGASGEKVDESCALAKLGPPTHERGGLSLKLVRVRVEERGAVHMASSLDAHVAFQRRLGSPPSPGEREKVSVTVALRLAASGCQVGSVPQVSRRVALRASDRAVVSIRSDESSEQPSTVDMASTSTAKPPAPATLPPMRVRRPDGATQPKSWAPLPTRDEPAGQPAALAPTEPTSSSGSSSRWGGSIPFPARAGIICSRDGAATAPRPGGAPAQCYSYATHSAWQKAPWR